MFEPTDGLDPEICQTFNDYTRRLRETFETRMNILSGINEDITQKLALLQVQKQVHEMTASELVNLAFLRNEGFLAIW